MNILKLLRGDRARRDYRDHGYHVFRGALPRELVNAVADTVCQKVRPYQGPILRQDGQLAAHDFFPGTSVIRNSLLDAHLPLSGPMKPIETTLTAPSTTTFTIPCCSSPRKPPRFISIAGRWIRHRAVSRTLSGYRCRTWISGRECPASSP